MKSPTSTNTSPSAQRVRARRRMGLGIAGALAAATLVAAGLAPASQAPPEIPEYPERTLSREWRGHRPDLNVDQMFRRDMPRQRSFHDAFRRPR